MHSLKGILTTLCDTVDGMAGALVITHDGMVIESNLDDGHNPEALAAFMSQIGLVIKRALTQMGHAEFTRYVMQSNQRSIYLLDLGKAVLVAVADLSIDAGGANVALFQAANEIKKTGRIDLGG